MTYFQLGGLSIPAIWLAAGCALVISSLFNLILSGEKVGDWYWTGFFYFFLTWKLSYLLFNLSAFIDMPLSIVYFNGGTKGLIVALIYLSVYFMLVAAKKDPTFYQQSTQVFLIYFISFEAIKSLLEQDIIETLSHLILLAGCLLLLGLSRKKKNHSSDQLFIVLVLLEMLIISIFYTILSVEVMTFIWIGLIVFMLNKKAFKEVRLLE